MGKRGDAAPTTLAVVDMGSNSFRLEVGRVEGDQVFRLDTVRETLRIGAQIDRKGRLTARAQRSALACLARFAERLEGLHPSAVRAVATNAFRIATNADSFLPKAEATLGFPIDVIGGHEEARLIYLGVAHVLPAESDPRLVIDIGGGSTEFVIGRGFEAERLESLKIGCVGMTQRFFPRGTLSSAAFKNAETHARAEIEAIARDFDRAFWHNAYASSGTALALAEILESNGWSSGGITPEGLAQLRHRMIRARAADRLHLLGLKPDRAPVLAGGLAVMSAALAELRVERIHPVGGAMRLGVLYDLLGRSIDRDSRTATVASFVARYRIDREHARRVADLAQALYLRAVEATDDGLAQQVHWAGMLHEVGLSVSHIGFHKHGAYIIKNADMPGFSAGEQDRLALLVLGCRGSLDKVEGVLEDRGFCAQVLALRIAVLLHHARRPIDVPGVRITPGDPIRLALPAAWLKAHPLSAHLMDKERAEWDAAGRSIDAGR